jgi:hypothetical protein
MVPKEPSPASFRQRVFQLFQATSVVSSVLDTSKTIEVIQEIQGTDHHELLEVFFCEFYYENVMFYRDQDVSLAR